MEVEEGGDHATLEADFTECELVLNKLEEGAEVPPEKVPECTKKLRALHEVVARSDMFSANDSLDDLPTGTLKLLLIEAYLARTLEHGSGPLEQREQHLAEIKSLYNGFLVTADVYNFSPINEGLARDCETRTVPQVLVADSIARTRKIQLLSQELALSEEVQALTLQCASSSDEELTRRLYEKKLRLWCLKAVGYTDLLNRELEMLKFRKTAPQRADTSPKQEPSTPLKTMFIPKRETEQKQVFGLGYPSAPTQTVNEWYDQQVQSGRFAGPSAPVTITGDSAQAEEADEEPVDEQAEEESRQRQMRLDEFKDVNPRGWGNMYGKG